MDKYTPHLDWINSQQNHMLVLLENWANINSGSHNLSGLAQMLSELKKEFAKLDAFMECIPLNAGFKIDAKGNRIATPAASALRVKKHPAAAIQVFLGGHMDTVYGIDSSFQTTKRMNEQVLSGPGVADMKGGLVILLTALQALERSPFAGKVGWEVLINPDEEIGSQGSEWYFIEASKRNHFALLFEPSFPDGAVVTSRKGSANYALVAKGKAAHAGRDFHLGCNAISAIVRFITEIESLNNPEIGTTINIGHIEGGGPINIVPDLAICRFNVRTKEADEFHKLQEQLHAAVELGNKHAGITLELHELASRGPKAFNKKNEKLFHKFQGCAKELGLQLEGRPSGGVCDGNILSEHGLATLDTLGVVGGNIHTHDEYMLINSLYERAQLTALFLMKLAEGNFYE